MTTPDCWFGVPLTFAEQPSLVTPHMVRKLLAIVAKHQLSCTSSAFLIKHYDLAGLHIMLPHLCFPVCKALQERQQQGLSLVTPLVSKLVQH